MGVLAGFGRFSTWGITDRTCSAAFDGGGFVAWMDLELGNCFARELRASVAVDVEEGRLFRWRWRMKLDIRGRGRRETRCGESGCPYVVVRSESK